MTATGADLIAQRLAAAGCRHAFGIPGGEVLALMDALPRAGIAFHLAKHENSAGFMAEGAWHATGAPGILLATIGPGVANAVNVVANALQDRVPLVVLSGCVDPAEELTFTHQVFDHTALLRPITKASLRVPADAVDVAVDKALAIALDGQPGPVHLDVPIGVAQGAAVPRGGLRRAAPGPVAPAAGPDLERARAWLAEARRPVVVAGLDALAGRGPRAVADFARRFGAPVVATYKAKGVLPEDDPASLGGAGLSPKADKRILPLLAEADLIVLAGYDPIEMRIGWRDPWGPDARVVSFDRVPNHHHMHQAGAQFVCDVAAGLEALSSGIDPHPTWPDGRPAEVKAALAADFAPPSAWGPHAAFAALRAALPPETVTTVDSGAHRILLSQMWTCPAPDTLLQSTALCTMGCALPLAIGRKLAEPARPVCAVMGDAGLEMVMGELATLRDTGLPVLVVVLVDESLGLIELKQRAMQLPNLGVDFSGTDFPALARAMGGHGRWIDDAGSLAEAARDALSADRFTLLAVRIGRRAYDGSF
jgi:acetolactate synthase-1/2/3 large subunit